MPTASEHDEQGRRNALTATFLGMLADPQNMGPLPDAARQWRLVATFYCAIHWTEARLREHGRPPSGSHRHRMKQVFLQWPHATQAHYALARLELRANRARYLTYIPTNQDLQNAEIDYSIVERGFRYP